MLSSESRGGPADDMQKVQLEVTRLHDPGLPGDLVRGGGTQLVPRQATFALKAA